MAMQKRATIASSRHKWTYQTNGSGEASTTFDWLLTQDQVQSPKELANRAVMGFYAPFAYAAHPDIDDATLRECIDRSLGALVQRILQISTTFDVDLSGIVANLATSPQVKQGVFLPTAALPGLLTAATYPIAMPAPTTAPTANSTVDLAEDLLSQGYDFD